MGDNAEMIMMGFVCQICGMPIDGDATGFPRSCDHCRPERFVKQSKFIKKRDKHKKREKQQG